MITYKELIKFAEKRLNKPDLARVFMLELLRDKDMDLYLLHDEPADETIKETYLAGLERLNKDEPLAYVLGFQWFYNSKILVNKDVLIPRPETEELVHHVLMDVEEFFNHDLDIVDVATGSGAIAIALAKELSITVDASDISEEALCLASRNAELNGTSVNFYQGDMLEPILGLHKKYDVLLCNPPYIKEIEDVERSVLDFEPHLALFGGDDGLYFYRKVFENAHLVLKERSFMAFEIAYDIGDALLVLGKSYFPEAKIELKQDINGLNRMLFIYRGLNHRD